MQGVKFRVWCEFEINGKIEKCMETEASWFLLTQTGQIMVYGPMTAPHIPEAAYKKLIPLFYTGIKDKNGKEICEGDIVIADDGGENFFPEKYNEAKDIYEPCGKYVVSWLGDMAGFYLFEQKEGRIEPIQIEWNPFTFDAKFEVIGNIYENPELLA
jgi:uncharacterized phage protein (TIGR01671 family)